MERKTFSFDVVDSVETWKTSTLYVVYMLSGAAHKALIFYKIQVCQYYFTLLLLR